MARFTAWPQLDRMASETSFDLPVKRPVTIPEKSIITQITFSMDLLRLFPSHIYY